MDDDHDEHGGRERDQGEAAQVEERLRFVEPEAEPDEPTQSDEADDVE
jgi:hypothetical protein